MRQLMCTFKLPRSRREAISYLLYLPRNYEAARRRAWPLIIFLHGAGEIGESPNDLPALRRHGIPRIVEEREDFPFICVSPQCTRQYWTKFYMRALPQLLDDLSARYRIDQRRIYLTGISMGGYGAWHLAATCPERFAAVVPFCGGGLPSFGFPEETTKLVGLPIWTFHGKNDSIVPLRETMKVVEALRKAGGDAKLTVDPDAGHDCWSKVFAAEDIYRWLLKQKKQA